MLLGVGIVASRAEPCGTLRPVNRDSWDNLGAGGDVCADPGRSRGCLHSVDCSRTNVVCSDEEPLYIPRYGDEGAPWKDIFTATREIPAIAYRRLQSYVIDPSIWWKLPSAVLLYRVENGIRDDDCESTHEYCRVPKGRLDCARAYAPDNAFPLPQQPLGDGLGTFLKLCGAKGFGNLYKAESIVIGLRRADILFDWLGIATVSFGVTRAGERAFISSETCA